MPSKSKSSKLGDAPPKKVPERKKPGPKFTYCLRCSTAYKTKTGNFPAVRSQLYAANEGFLPICRDCVEDMYNHYMKVLGDERQAIRRICMKFDLYWSESIYQMLDKPTKIKSRISNYIAKTTLNPFKDKSFDTTIDEEQSMGVGGVGMYIESALPSVEDGDEDGMASDSGDDNVIAGLSQDIIQELIDFWGSGLAPSFYIELDKRYKFWTGGDDSTMDIAARAIIKQICMLEVTINRDSAQGKSIEKNVNALNNLLGSANLKPVQKKDSGIDNAADNTPFGVWIRKIENTEPIPEPEDEFKDVDGIARYIHIWFFGHLCKMVGIKNSYSRMYEEEMARLRVEKPEYEEEDDDAIFEDLFSRTKSEEPLSGDRDAGGE